MKKHYFITGLLIIFLLFIKDQVKAQTNPAAQPLQYSQNFASLASAYLAGWQGWKIGTASSAAFVITPATSDRSIITPTPSTAATVSSGIHNFSQKIGFLSDTADVAIVLVVNTMGISTITARFDIMTMRNVQDGVSNTRIKQVDLQYRIGTIGNFTSVSGNPNGIYQNNNVNQVTGSNGLNIASLSIALPAACNNQAVVQLRFVQRDFSGIGARPSFAIDNVCISSIIPSITITGSSVFCGGTARYVANTVNGGTLPAYQWKKNSTVVGTNSNTLDITGLVVSDTIRCVLTSNVTCFTVTSNDIRINSTAASPNMTGFVTHSSCGQNNGSISLNVSGGASPYTYCWDTTNTVNGPSFAVTVAPKNSAHPYFNMGVLGNTAAFWIDGIQAKRLMLTRGINYAFSVVGGHPFNIATDSVGGFSTFIANGQTGAPTGLGTVNFRPNSTHANPTFYTCQAHSFMGYKIDLQSFCLTTPNLTNRKSGTYAVIITDANGCTVQSQFVINPSTFNLAVTAISTSASCNAANGSINTTVTGGTAPYTLCWDTINRTNGAQFGVTVGTKTSSNPYFGLGSTVGYFIDGVEAKQITLAKNINYTFNIFNPGHPWHISTDSIGGSTAGIVTNGQSGAPNDNGIVTFRPDNSHPSLLRYDCSFHPYMGYNIKIANAYCVEDPTGLTTGTYTVNVTDANGCQTSANFTVGSAAAFTASLTSTSNVSCYGKADGGVNFTPVGGVAPYSVTGTGPTFTVIAEIKNHSHPQYGTGSVNGFTINGKQGKELTLIRGITYNFAVLTPGHPFFISTSVVGGPSNLASEVTNGVTNSMTTSGTLTFTPNATHPQLLYYQCAAHNNMGWKINIVDQLGAGDLDSCIAGNYNLAVKDGSGCNASSFNVVINEPAGITYFYDGDTDLFGNNNETTLSCTVPPGFTSIGGDCNDSVSTIHPGAIELCNTIDDNCNSLIDEGLTLQTLFFDNDSDGYGAPPSQTFCNTPLHWVTSSIDCDNNDPGIHPGATELCNNGIDENCNTLIDENCDTTLTIKVFLQGYYFANQVMSSPLHNNDANVSDLLCDTIIIELHDTTSLYNILLSDTAIVTVNGLSNIPIPPNLVSATVYIVIRSRNTIETWSKNPVQLGISTFYNFASNSAGRSSLLLNEKMNEH